MVYKDGSWGEKAKIRSKLRLEYFKGYVKKKYERSFNSFGSVGELLALKILKGSVLVRKSECDLMWDTKKIEVKTSLYNGKFYKFHTGRQKGKADYFLLVCVAKKGMIDKIYFIPDHLIPSAESINIKKDNKWNKFIIESGVK